MMCKLDRNGVANHDNCNGCVTYSYPDAKDSIDKPDGDLRFRCRFIHYNHKGECPCTLCLIKMMCNDSCDPFDYFNSECIDAHATKINDS